MKKSVNTPTLVIKVWAQYLGRKGLSYSIRDGADDGLLLAIGGGLDYEDTMMVIKKEVKRLARQGYIKKALV